MTSWTAESAADLLARHCLLHVDDKLSVEELSGGVSSDVIRLIIEGSNPSSFVLKRALPQLKVTQQWSADVERIWREASALRICTELLTNGIESPNPEGMQLRIPQLIATDEPTHSILLESVPFPHQTWKQMLLRGNISHSIARSAGAMLGILHRESRRRPIETKELSDQRYFRQLRIEPYFQSCIAKHGSLAQPLNELIDALCQSSYCLVHGDYSPKNILVTDRSIWLIDFEVAHLGHPAFDVGFLLTHLALKQLYLYQARSAIKDTIFGFVSAYRRELTSHVGPTETNSLVSLGLDRIAGRCWLGCLLSRVDGKSPVDYLSPGLQEVVRQFVFRQLAIDHPPLEQLLEEWSEWIHTVI